MEVWIEEEFCSEFGFHFTALVPYEEIVSSSSKTRLGKADDSLS